MLNFQEINKPIQTAVPVKNNQFIYNRKKYILADVEDGWYDVEIQGNVVKGSCPCFPSFEKRVKGYTYNNNFIPVNFDSFKKSFGYEVMTLLHFNNVPTMSAVEAIRWEDNNFYFYSQDFSNMKVFEIQGCIDEEGHLDITGKKGLTPELKTLLLFHSIEKKNQIELKKKLEEEKRIEEYKASMPGRLMLSFQEVGAEVVDYSMEGNNLVVNWKLRGNSQLYNSVIDSRNFKVVQAGYCMSNDDKRHNIKSMVLTAKDYEKDGLTYITRRNN